MCYVILSDIHANATALQAVLEITDRLRRHKKFYFLGDLLGYGPVNQVIDCLDWLRYKGGFYFENGPTELRWLPGNHDELAVTCAGEARTEALITLDIQRIRLAASRRDDWGWFVSEVRQAFDEHSLLTKTRKVGENTLFMAFTHGAVDPVEVRRNEYLYPWMPDLLRTQFDFLRSLSDANTKILFCGHTHFPYLAQLLLDERHTLVFHSIKYGAPITLEPGEYIVSPGSVGHPRDGDPRAAFVLFEPDELTVEFRRVEYDTKRVVNDLENERAGLGHEEREQVIRHLMGLEKKKLEEQGIRLDGRIPPKVRNEYRDRVDQAYKNLIHEIQTGSGGELEQYYHAKVYRVPPYDLESVGNRQ